MHCIFFEYWTFSSLLMEQQLVTSSTDHQFQNERRGMRSPLQIRSMNSTNFYRKWKYHLLTQTICLHLHCPTHPPILSQKKFSRNPSCRTQKMFSKIILIFWKQSMLFLILMMPLRPATLTTTKQLIQNSINNASEDSEWNVFDNTSSGTGSS